MSRKNEKLKSWNAHNLASQADVDYDRFARALQHESGINLSDEESKRLLDEGKKALGKLSEILNKGKAL